MYTWQKKHYLGACHGLSGILHILLLALTLTPNIDQELQAIGQQRNQEKETQQQRDIPSELKSLIRSSLDFLVRMRFPSGNFPASIDDDDDDDLLVQWCHGAPGLIPVFVNAANFFSEKKYLEVALQGCNVVWQKGLLTKGLGLCHGVGGNGYSFLYLYKATKDPKHLYRAFKFAEWASKGDVIANHFRRADNPYSLFEGIAGTVCFFCHLIKPENIAFPGFDFPTPTAGTSASTTKPTQTT